MPINKNARLIFLQDIHPWKEYQINTIRIDAELKVQVVNCSKIAHKLKRGLAKISNRCSTFHTKKQNLPIHRDVLEGFHTSTSFVEALGA